MDRRLIVVEQPIGTVVSRNPRYRIEDPYLRFWLAYLADKISAIEAGRGDVVLKTINDGWFAWRGRAVEPVIRDLLWRSRNIIPEVGTIGGWWNRTNSVEVDLVGADSKPVARRISFVGSIKWKERTQFEFTDFASLVESRKSVPGAADAPLIAVSRSGFGSNVSAIGDLIQVTPEQLIATEPL